MIIQPPPKNWDSAEEFSISQWNCGYSCCLMIMYEQTSVFTFILTFPWILSENLHNSCLNMCPELRSLQLSVASHILFSQLYSLLCRSV